MLNEIFTHVNMREFAWDCGAGSGQFTQLLSSHFKYVVATDLSAQQLKHAPKLDNVQYSVQQAEKTSFADQSFDLITVAQAIHWLNFDDFYREVKRTLKPNGILAVVGYGLLHVDHVSINAKIQHVYHHILGSYWNPELRYIDEAYQTIPFVEISVPKFTMSYEWNATQLLGFLNTWSAVKHFKQQTGKDPLLELIELLQPLNEQFRIQFPILLRIGRLQSV